MWLYLPKYGQLRSTDGTPNRYSCMLPSIEADRAWDGCVYTAVRRRKDRDTPFVPPQMSVVIFVHLYVLASVRNITSFARRIFHGSYGTSLQPQHTMQCHVRPIRLSLQYVSRPKIRSAVVLAPLFCNDIYRTFEFYHVHSRS